MSNESADGDVPPHRSSLIAQRCVLGIAFLLFTLNLWRYGAYLLDDTFISFRYAQNLVAGNGLVFNVGERVEGYTNFLFVLIAALCLRLGIDPVVGTKAISLVCTVLLAVTVVYLEGHAPSCPAEDGMSDGRDGPSAEGSGPQAGARPITLLALALLLPLPGFAYWAAASFETMTFASLALLALALLQRECTTRRSHGSIVVFVLLALTRPEGAFLFASATAIFFIVAARSSWRQSAINVTLFAVGYGIYFAWRYTYYGDLLPNTFRAKVTGGWEQALTGLQYLGGWARTYPFLALGLLLPVACLSRGVRDAASVNASMSALYAVAITYAAYVTLVGGDFMPFHRFFIPILPLCCLFLAWAIATLPPRWRSGAVLLVFPLHVVCGYLTDEPYRAFVAHRTAVVGRRVGERLAQQLAASDLIAVNTAGALPYYSARPAIDMLGLTDATIAQRPVFIVSAGWAGHRRGWGAYVLDRHPRVIFFYNSTGSREPFYLSDHELADNPYFRFFYQAKTFSIPPPDDGNHASVGRFMGFPFGFDVSGRAPWRDLGLESSFDERPLAMTTLYEGTTVANYFAFDARDEDLWAARQAENIDAFLHTVIARWSTGPHPASNPAAREEVETLCAAAHAKIEAGDTAAAKTLLTTAARQNDRAHSPLVYQYIANVAVLDNDLFTAVSAQKEALRLAPANELYRRNLLNLLQRPYKQ